MKDSYSILCDDNTQRMKFYKMNQNATEFW